MHDPCLYTRIDGYFFLIKEEGVQFTGIPATLTLVLCKAMTGSYSNPKRIKAVIKKIEAPRTRDSCQRCEGGNG
jgi:hypothetical protein